MKRFWFAFFNADKFDSLRKEAARLRDLNADLDQQVREALAGHPMSDDQLAHFAEVKKDNDSMRYEANAIVVYLRTRWPEDFQSGRHGDRSLSQIVIRYLARIEDQSHAAKV